MKLKALNSIDFYKSGHGAQYPEGSEYVYSNFTPRTGKPSNIASGKGVVNFGLQGFVKWFLIDLWDETFFKVPIDEVIKQYKRRLDNSLGKDSVSMDHIIKLHEMGFLPLEIKALPEGAFVPYGVPVLTMVNTCPDFAWLTNYLESVMSAELWKPITSATTALEYRKKFEEYSKSTGYDDGFIQWQGHDFSFRGMSGVYDSMASGAGHLTSFFGTDSIPAIDYLEEYYYADSDTELVGGSVPATEHSVMCMGTLDGELETFKRLVTEVYPSGVVSVVSDTWDLWAVLTDFLPKLKDEIMARDGRVVIRPDSGDPVDIICGTNPAIKEMTEDEFNDNVLCAGGDADGMVINYKGKYYLVAGIQELIEDYGHDSFQPLASEFGDLVCGGRYGFLTEIKSEDTPAGKGVYELLWDIFGGTVNDQGYKVLDDHIGAIYGDSITLERQDEILKRLKAKGFCASNLVLGIGSFTYQYVTRDTHGFAMKATYGIVNGKGRDIFKDPITDDGMKKSAKGLLRVGKRAVKDADFEYFLEDQITASEEKTGELETVFLDGKLIKKTSLAEIRGRVNSLVS